MKTFLITLTLGLLFLGGHAAQAQGCLSGIEGAVPDDTVSLSITLTVPPPAGDTTVYESGRKKESSGQIAWELVFWNTQQGPAISVDPSTIVFSGDGSVIDSLTVQAIFDLISRTSIAQGIARGQIPCTVNCGVTIPVYLPACVRRQGTGTATQLISCDPNSCCKRNYSICCPDGSAFPLIEQVSSTSPGCGNAGPGCIPTCQ